MNDLYRLLDVCDFQGGTQPPKNEWKKEKEPGYIRMLQIRDYSQDSEKYAEYVKDSKKLHKCKKDDIMLSRYGYIGQAFMGLEGAYNVALVKVIKLMEIETNYLLYYFKSKMFQHYLLSNVGARATISGFNKSELEDAKIKVPLQEEQLYISGVLRKIEEIIKKREKELQQMNELIKARFVELFGDPLHPICYKELGEIALLERGRFSPRPRNDPKYFNGDYPFIQTGDISSSGHRLVNYKQTLNELGIGVSKQFVKGTIVMAIVGATIGATAILERDVYAPDSVIGITPYRYNNIFLETLLQFWQPELLANAPECARPNINLSILEKVPIVEADVALQNQFADFVKQVDKSKVVVQL